LVLRLSGSTLPLKCDVCMCHDATDGKPSEKCCKYCNPSLAEAEKEKKETKRKPIPKRKVNKKKKKGSDDDDDEDDHDYE
jgi:hypothetical protein